MEEKIKDIIKACMDNNRQGQSNLYKIYASKMYAVCLRYAGNAFDAQDLLQEGFVKIFKNLKSYKWNGSFEGWMKRIFINLALDKYRSKYTMLSIEEAPNGTDYDSGEASAIDSMSEKEILNLVQKLPSQYRMVFNLYVLEGMSHQEIGKLMDIGESTSRSNLVRAKNILKEKININSGWVEKAI